MTPYSCLILVSASLLALVPSITSAADTVAAQQAEESGDEITLLINSTFVIIEDLEVNSTDVVNGISKPLKLGKRRKSVSTTCRTFTAKEKYEVLEGVGARNQHYMAETPDEASKGFAAPTPEPQLRTFADTVETDADYCNEECQLIRTTLERVMNERSRTNQKSPPRALLTSRRALSDAGPMEVDEGVGQNQACALETFVPLGNCSEPGEEVSWAHEQLCSICRGIYILGENCFPTFFNSVLCNQQETGCIFDNFSNRAHGICRPETLSLRVLRNRGDTECEDWVIEQIELPVACQCLLSKGSWLRSRPPKEL